MVTQNHSVVCNDGKYTLENGCTVKLDDMPVNSIENEVWKPLRKEFNLGCGHIKVKGGFCGCVLNFLKKS